MNKDSKRINPSDKSFPQLINFMEVAVFNQLDHVLKDLQVCSCDICRHDIAAITLNSLPPKYVVTQKGQIYTKLDSLQQQFEVDIIAAITKAANIVNKSPRHN